MAKSYTYNATYTTACRQAQYDASTGATIVWTNNVNHDLFPDDFATDDIFAHAHLYVSAVAIHYSKISKVRVIIDVPMVADAYELAFEYWDGSAWQPFSNLVDGTNKLTQTGDITWDVPAAMNGGLSYLGIGNYLTIMRVRIVSSTNPTEGGHITSWRTYDNTIVAIGSASDDKFTFADFYDYAVNTLGRADIVKTFEDRVDTALAKTFYCNVIVGNGTDQEWFTATNEAAEFRNVAICYRKTTLGIALLALRFTRGAVTWGLFRDDCDGNFSRSIITKYLSTSFFTLTFAGAINFSRSHVVISGSSEFRATNTVSLEGCNIIASAFDIYTTGVNINDATFSGYPRLHGDRTLDGATIQSTYLDYTLYGGRTLTLIDEAADYDPTSGAATCNGYIHRKRRLDFRIIDENGDGIGAAGAVRIVDADEDEIVGSPFTTDVNGDISQQQLFQNIDTFTAGFASKSRDEKTPHIATIVVPGYRFRTSILVMDQRRVEVETLEALDETPPAFAGLTSATDRGTSGEVTLSWDAASDPGSGVAGYRIYYHTADDAAAIVAQGIRQVAAADATGAVVGGLVDGTVYYFIVRAYDLEKPGNEDTNEVIESARPSPPEPISQVITFDVIEESITGDIVEESITGDIVEESITGDIVEDSIVCDIVEDAIVGDVSD